MAGPTKKMMPKTSGRKKQTPATLRSLSGAGFEFEDLISAWLQVKMLIGEPIPEIGGTSTQLQAQVSSLGWHIDDLLLTTQSNAGSIRRLAISAKGNLQATASGLPADFVKRAWEQWHDPQSPMNRSSDSLALVTRGTDYRVFYPNWREVKNACTGTDVALTISRIRSNPKQSKVFSSVQMPDQSGLAASDEETIELIRRLHVLPVDLQFAYSETKNQSIAQCRQLLESKDAMEAENLWQRLINVATEVRVSRGTITLQYLWSLLREEFDLRHHPDYARDWETISNITSDYKARIETELLSGYSVPRMEEKLKFENTISANAITVVFGESGSGKSALVKNVLDSQFEEWTQVWFGPEELKMALSAARRGTLPLRHELARVLNATVNPKNILVVDSAERIDPAEFGIIRQLLQIILASTGQVDDCAWRIVIITQTQSWVENAEVMLGGRQAAPVELELLKNSDVKLALLVSPSLGWPTGHDDTVSTLTNLKTLAWVIKASTAFGSNVNGLVSHNAIADRLWNYWTGNQPSLMRLMMSLAKREASFERSFALTDLDAADVVILEPWPDKLPLHLNQCTNRIEFEHDLAADWARFQFLKQIWTDTTQWSALAENPLWTNGLRMLGQFLLRKPAGSGTAWDIAFQATQEIELYLAGDILLDALCLDPEAERFLTERVNLLLANDAKHLTRLLIRFHHIGTVPAGGVMGTAASLGLYLETQYRSIIIGRWPPVLRFLISQREKLSNLASSAVAKVIQTWLTGMPRELGNGTPVPFRRELADIALAMARTVQVKKGHRDMFLTYESLLYTAPLAGAADLPDEVGAWALELAGRKKVASEVSTRIAQALHQQAEQHEARLRTDPAYKARHEGKRQIPFSLSSFREHLIPWPLGAQWQVDIDFRETCFKKNGLQPLMYTCPDVAAEVLLALIIEDQPEREHGSSRYKIELGLEWARDGYPTAFWKSPFFTFLQIATDVALKALIALVNFCTERWSTEVMGEREGPVPGLKIQLAEGGERTFAGGWQVFDWTQTNSHHNGNLFCALDALERWLTLQLDAGIDVTPYVEQILRNGESSALVGLLVNVGKFRPSLFSGALAPLLTDPHVFFWDSYRVENIGAKFDNWSWARAGEEISNLARDWTLAPHRQKSLQDVVVELLKTNTTVSDRLLTLISSWALPEDPEAAWEFRLLFAALNRHNYRPITHPETGEEVLAFACPADLSLDVQSWQGENAKPMQYLLLPRRCEQLLQAQQIVRDNNDAAYLFNLLKECEADLVVDENEKAKCMLALAATLIVLADNWLEKTAGAKEDTQSIVRTAVDEIASTAEEFRSIRVGHARDDLKFAAYAAMHLWLKNDEQALEWEASVLRLLTSGDSATAGTIVSIAYAYRQQLGSAWWRLLQAGVLWSGLVLLLPHHGEIDGMKRTWGIWLSRLRRFPLRGKNATVHDLKPARVAAASERLDFYRRMRAFISGDKLWLGNPERRSGMGLDGNFLDVLFHWLINGPGTGDWAEDAKLLKRLWTYEAERMRARAKEDKGEYGLPSQNFGYDLLLKHAELSLTAPKTQARAVWELVLEHGPEAHYALQHFIHGLFLRLSKGDHSGAFEQVWRAIVEYGLSANWGQQRLWFYGEQLICDLLGFGNEEALRRLSPGAAQRMRDVYERWAELHLERDEDCVKRFCYFLTTEFGAPLRLDGLRWTAAMVKVRKSDYWCRGSTGDALIELINISLNQNAQALANDCQARQALVEIVATLTARNVPAALVLQERIKLLR